MSHRKRRFELLFFNIIRLSINIKEQCYVRTTNAILLLGEMNDNL